MFALRFQFDTSYPITPPAVTFVVDEHYKAPVHPVRFPVAVRVLKLKKLCNSMYTLMDTYAASATHSSLTADHAPSRHRFAPRS
jgi:ubiquitin-protein ligase